MGDADQSFQTFSLVIPARPVALRRSTTRDRLLDELRVVDRRVRGGDHDRVVRRRVERDGLQADAVGLERRHMGVVVGDRGAGGAEQLDQLHRRRLAPVVDVRLVGDARGPAPSIRDRLARAVVERLDDARAAVVRHVLVDLAGELDEPRREVELARLPREVERVDRDAVAAEARAGIERHEAERLRRRGVDRPPRCRCPCGRTAASAR